LSYPYRQRASELAAIHFLRTLLELAEQFVYRVLMGLFAWRVNAWVVAVIVTLLGCAAKRAERSTPSEVAFNSSAEQSVFSRVAPAADRRAEPTSLLGVPDTEVVAEIVRVRVRAAMRRAFADAMSAMGKEVSSRPVLELVSSLESVLFDGTDVEARSQALLGVLLRNGLSYAFATAGGALAGEATCTDLHDRATAVYEAMAASPRIRKLGFTKATGTVPVGCTKTARLFSELIDAATTVGLSAEPLSRIALAVGDVRTSCTPGVLSAVGVELRSAIAGASSLGDDITLGDVATIREAFAQSQAQFDKDLSLVRAEADQCHRGLSALVRAADAVPSLFSLGGDVELTEIMAALDGLVGKLLGLAESVEADALAAAVRLGRVAGEVASIKASVAACGAAIDATATGDTLPEQIRTVLAACPAGGCPTACAELGAAGSALAEVRVAVERSLRERSAKLRRVVDAGQACAGTAPTFEAIARAAASCTAGTECATSCPTLNAVYRANKADVDAAIARSAQLVIKLLGYAGQVAASVSRLEELTGVLRALVEGRAPNRGDLVVAANGLRALGDKLPEGLGRRVLHDLVDAAPQLVKEESAGRGIHIDTAGATAIVLNRLSESRSRWHLRAAIGTGYLHVHDGTAAIYEELGVGVTIAGESRVRIDLNAFTSGLLYQIAASEETEHRIFVGGGPSVRLYDLIDVSAAAGSMFDLETGDAHFAVMFGLQVPLIDYISALAGSSATVAKP
jgi:hypothetical protein